MAEIINLAKRVWDSYKAENGFQKERQKALLLIRLVEREHPDWRGAKKDDFVIELMDLSFEEVLAMYNNKERKKETFRIVKDE